MANRKFDVPFSDIIRGTLLLSDLRPQAGVQFTPRIAIVERKIRAYESRQTKSDGVRDEAAILAEVTVASESRLLLGIAARFADQGNSTGAFGQVYLHEGWYLEARSTAAGIPSDAEFINQFYFGTPIIEDGAVVIGVIDTSAQAATLQLEFADGSVINDSFVDGCALLYPRLTQQQQSRSGKVTILDSRGQDIYARQIGLPMPTPA
jgi:hypothetical protein